MPKTPDTPRVARRRRYEKLMVSQMISLYCNGHHPSTERTEHGHCGKPLCAACAELDRFAVLRTEHCRKMETKTSCKNCEHHCYPPAMEERIRAVMRYAGPRMIFRHPIAVIRHMLGK